jgi:hypothetical protein
MTEFMQPINPMRVCHGDADWSFTTPVFAIAISKSDEIEYLTINGSFFTPHQVKFAEMNINGQWVRLESHKMPYSPPTSST